MLRSVPPVRLFTISAIVAALFCAANVAIDRTGWAIAFGALAVVWGLTAFAVRGRPPLTSHSDEENDSRER